MFTRKTILGEEQVFGNGLIVATVSDIDDKNVRLKFGYDYDAVIPKNEFDFDVKKDGLVHINVKSLSSLSGPVASFSDVKDYVSITLKREHYKKNLAKEALLYTSIPPIIVPPNGSPILKGSLPFPGLRKSGWYYYFEIVEPKGIVIRKDALLIPDVLFFDTPLNPEYHKKEMQEIAKKGIEIVRDYETKGFIPAKEFNNLTQDRMFIDNISIFMTLNQAEPITASKDNNYENPRTGFERDFIHRHRVRANEPMMYTNRRPSVHASGVIDEKAPESDTLENEPIIMERICDISDCDLETIEEFLRSAKLKEDTEMVLIKCRGAVENILKEIIKIDNRIDSDKYSRKTSGEILNDDYIRKLFSETSYIHWYKNTLFVACLNTIITVCVCTFTGYIFSRFKFPYRKTIMSSMVVLQMFPSFIGMIATYVILWKLNALNTLWGLVLVYSAGSIPANTWLMKGYFDTIPKDLSEAAYIDGATPMRAFVSVVVPSAKPQIVFLTLTSFTGPWMDFIFPKLILRSDDKKTLAVGLYEMISGRAADKFTMFAAGALLVAVPFTVIFCAGQKSLLQSLAGTGGKE